MSGVSNLYMTNADGSSKPERLTTSEYAQAPSSWAASGNAIAYSEEHAGDTLRFGSFLWMASEAQAVSRVRLLIGIS